MAKKQDISFRFGLLCDDVRQESNGKLIAIGIYGSDMILPATPVDISPILLLLFDVAEERQYDITVQASLDGKPISKGRIGFDGKAGKNNMASIPVPMHIAHPGQLVITICVAGRRPTCLIDIPVRLAPGVVPSH